MDYVASPLTHEDEAVMEQRATFAEQLTARLIKAGYHAFSPVAHTWRMSKAANLPYLFGYWAEFDYECIRLHSRVFATVVEGWLQSHGMRMEIRYAYIIQKPVYLLNPVNLDLIRLRRSDWDRGLSEDPFCDPKQFRVPGLQP